MKYEDVDRQVRAPVEPRGNTARQRWQEAGRPWDRIGIRVLGRTRHPIRRTLRESI